MDNSLLTDEERAEFWGKYKEVALEDAMASGAGAGWVIEGANPYANDWDMDLSWPETAGTKINGEWIADSWDAKISAATFITAKRDKKTGRVRENTLKRVSVLGDDNIQKMREAAGWQPLKEWYGNPDPFAYGQDQLTTGGVYSQYLPLWPGPVTRQLYWQDYWQMSAKAFEAYNHDPVSWRCVHMKAEFALGPGIERKVTYSRGPKRGQSYDKAQQVFDEFWTRNKMDARCDMLARDYCWGGELFLRYFRKGPKLTIRALDPATIYDLITDPEDIETVFAYHQQFQTAYQLYAPQTVTPPTGIQAPTGATQPGSIVRYIIRQILPQEIDHYKANCSGYERRGRSDLFPALGWIKRLRDYLTAHVIQADMLSRICWDLTVAGNASAVQAVRNALFPGGRAPQPGTVFGHNTASTLAAVAPTMPGARASRGDPVLDALVTMVSLSAGLPKDWLGFGLQNTRAGALVATEPGAKSLVELQGTLEGMIDDSFNRVMLTAGISDAELETTFPSIAQEDRGQKLDDLGTMEAMEWLSKQTAATLAAKEMGITTYDFATEQKLIAKEFPAEEHDENDTGLLGPDGKPFKSHTPKQGDGKVRRPSILATKRQALKLDPTLSPSETVEDQPPGLQMPVGDGTTVPATGGGGGAGGPISGGKLPAPGSQDGTGRTVAGGGSHNNGNSRLGAPNNENPNTSAGRKDIRTEHTRIHESEPVYAIPHSLLVELMRETHGPRKRPDDPEYQAAADRYRKEAQTNLRELADSAKGEQ